MKLKMLILLAVLITAVISGCSGNETVEYSGEVDTYIVSGVEKKFGSRGGSWYEVHIRTDTNMESFTSYDNKSFIKGDTIKVLTKTITITKECE